MTVSRHSISVPLVPSVVNLTTDSSCPPLIVNNQPVELGADERLNCIQAAQRIGFEIPHYCWHPALSVVASCRMCLVEVGAEEAGRHGRDAAASWCPAARRR